jgi:hypothetical protein
MHMKKSDKLLFYSFITAFGIFLLVDVLHYINYRRGNILDFAAIEQRDFVSHAEDGVHWLVLDGPMRTHFYPADRLKIDVDRSQAARVHFQRDGDTLRVSIADYRARSAHDAFNSYGNYVPVQVFFPPLTGIRLINGFAVLDNEEARKGINVTMELDSTQCWVGNYNPDRDSVLSIEPWDTIRAKVINGNLILNRQAHVKALELSMDDKAEASDRFSRIDTAIVQGKMTTTLLLRGENFKRLLLKR